MLLIRTIVDHYTSVLSVGYCRHRGSLSPYRHVHVERSRKASVHAIYCNPKCSRNSVCLLDFCEYVRMCVCVCVCVVCVYCVHFLTFTVLALDLILQGTLYKALHVTQLQ